MSQRFKLENRRRDVVPLGYIDGLIMSNGTDATNDIDLSIGEATLVDSSSNGDRILTFQDSVVTKRSDLDWTEGTGGGGLASGARSSADTLNADTWYHYFMIGKGDGRRTDGGFDTSLTAANLLADATGYGYYRRVGSILSNSSNTIIAFLQIGNHFYWSPPKLDLNFIVNATTRFTETVFTPLGVATNARFIAHYAQTTAGRWIYFSSAGAADVAPASTVFHLGGGVDSDHSGIEFTVRTNTSSQIHWRANHATGTLFINCLGWEDPRGQTWA